MSQDSQKIGIFKMVTGEEIITKYTCDTGTEHYYFERPQMVTMTQTQTGHVGLQLIPWIKSAPDETVRVAFIHTAGDEIEAPKEFEDAYLQTVSGIELPGQS